jgi:phospholipid N-methyltransferase
LFKSKINRVSAIAGFSSLSIIKGLSFFSLIPSKKPILEIGAGIGTVTKVLLENYTGDVYAHELNDFCFSKLEKIRKSDYKQSKKRLHLTSNLDDFTGIDFCVIVIDGPISKKHLCSIVQNSSELKLVIIDNYRLLQRVWVAKALRKAKFRQQFIEILVNEKPSAAVFFTFKQTKELRIHTIIDYVLVFLRIFPKLARHIYSSKGRVLTLGDKIEVSFERSNRKV